MAKKKAGKYLGIAAVCTIIGTLSFWALCSGIVFGKFEPAEPYVTGAPESLNNIIITSEGSNLKGEMGSGASPCTKEVPTAEGKKGSKTNPFVILEIVPDHAQQQIAYVAAEDHAQEPLDMLKYGIELSKEQGKSFVPGSSGYMDNEQLKKLGQWFTNWQYEVYKIGTDEKELISYANIAKLYTAEFTAADLQKKGIDPNQFKQDYESSKEQISSREGIDLKKLIGKSAKYAELFETDTKGNKIREIAVNDKTNWKPSFEKRIIQEAVRKEYNGKGYILAVEPGKGDFGFASENDARNWVFTKTGTAADRWKYVEREEDIPAEYVAMHSAGAISGSGFWHNGQGIGWSDIGLLYSQYLTDNRITGLYMALAENSWITCRYDIEPEVSEEVYTFKYYGIYNKNIIKRQLFLFADQKDYDNFNMKVITMTPSELNAMAKKDTDDTLDMIERADMFYIGAYDSGTGNINNVYDLYYKYGQGKDKTPHDISQSNTYVEDDLEWELCYKILYRLCNNKNLPMIMTQGLGKLVEKGTADIPMYQTSTYRNIPRRGTLCNVAKLYLIGIQFDLTAKKAEDSSYIQTFYDDFLMPGKINRIALGDKSISQEKGVSDPAVSTGYYVRPRLAEGVEQSEQEKCYYIWNTLTFFPPEMEYIFYNGEQADVSSDVVDAFVARGFMRSFFQSSGSTPNKIFTEGGQTIRQDGSDGSVGNVGIPHQNGDALYSTLLGNTESAGVFNTVMDVAYQIMNNRPDIINKQPVIVQKQKNQYVKMGDTSVLLDFVQGQNYDNYRKYDSDNPMYLKVLIHNNGNGQPGVVTKLTLKNEEGETAPQDADLKLYSSRDNWAMQTRDNYLCEKATYHDSNGTVTGYNVDGTLVAYIPYSLKQWSNGYNIVEVKTVGRIYSIKKKKYLKGNVETDEITIDERTLFNLE